MAYIRSRKFKKTKVELIYIKVDEAKVKKRTKFTTIIPTLERFGGRNDYLFDGTVSPDGLSRYYMINIETKIIRLIVGTKFFNDYVNFLKKKFPVLILKNVSVDANL